MKYELINVRGQIQRKSLERITCIEEATPLMPHNLRVELFNTQLIKTIILEDQKNVVYKVKRTCVVCRSSNVQCWLDRCVPPRRSVCTLCSALFHHSQYR